MGRAPVLAHDREELRVAIAEAGVGPVGFVPTMGALHAGHASLMARARQEIGEGVLVVSIFVNPTQFAPGEDLDRYPRTLDADLRLCADQGVDVVFVPSVGEIYPAGVSEASLDGSDGAVTVDPGPLAEHLEGASRPTHFRGVLTVVAKLFGLVRPDVAVFGQKDYQQLALIRRMASDLCLPIEVVGGETVREPDGLAMSSRNRYLEGADREHAVTLSRALHAAQRAAVDGGPAALDAAREELRRTPEVAVDYLALTALDLGAAPESGEARMLVAARVGATRLIDNMPITIGASTGPAGGDHAHHQPAHDKGDS